MRTLITNIKSLVQVEEKPKIAVCGQDMSSINCIDNAYLIIENDKIVDFGQMSQLQDTNAEKIIDANIMDDTLKVGDQVTIIGQKSLGFQAILLAYILPFIVIIATLFIVNVFTTNEIIIGTCALASLIPYFIVLRLMRNKIQAKFQFYAIKKIVQSNK